MHQIIKNYNFKGLKLKEQQYKDDKSEQYKDIYFENNESITLFNIISLLYIILIIYNIKSVSKYNSENNLYHVVFPMFYLGILYYFTGYYSNSVIIFYIIKTLILLSCGLPELDNIINKDEGSSTTPTDFQESDYSIFNIFKSIELNIKYRKEYLEIQKKFPNVYLGLPKYISAVKKAEFYGNYTIRGILTYTDCVLIFILLGMSYSNTSTYYFVDNTILYGPGPFGSGDWKYLLELYYKNDDENDNENQLGELFKFVSGFYSLP